MEPDFPHLNRAPIREAVLDIKVEPRPELDADHLAAFVETVRAAFPDAKPIRGVRTEFDLQGDEPGVRSSPPQTLGTICWNEGKTRAVQARIDGFTVNHVQGYESWDVLRKQARSLWTDYLALAAPVRVTRCALRYINRLELPVLVEMNTTLLTRPEIGTELPQLVDDFFMRLVVPFAEGRKAAITQASEPIIDAAAGHRGLILDIDAFSNRTFEIGDDAMWLEFDALRAIKNVCFFRSLRPETWEAYR